MRLKQTGTLLLTSVLLMGTAFAAAPVPAYAETPTNTFTLTVPADTNITAAGWNEIGEVKVTGDIAATKKVTVSITTDNGSKLKSGDNEIDYTIKKTSADTEATSSLEFTATAVNGKTASQTIGADVADFGTKPAGKYTDTINFEASMADDSIPAQSVALSCPKATIDEGKSFTITATVSPENTTNKTVNWKSSNSDIITVDENGKVTAQKEGTATITATAADDSGVSVSCEVTVASVYGTTENGKIANGLSSAYIGDPSDSSYSPFTVSSGDVQGTFVSYDSFISHTEKSSWNDATAFVKALNDAYYAGYSNWSIFSTEEMAMKWRSKGGKNVDRGNVAYLWSAEYRYEDLPYYLDINTGGYPEASSANCSSYYGFLLIRCISN